MCKASEMLNIIAWIHTYTCVLLLSALNWQYTVKAKCTHHSDDMLIGTVGVLVTHNKV